MQPENDDHTTPLFTHRDIAILTYLLQKPNLQATYDELLTDVWSLSFNPNTNLVPVAVSRLRSRLIAAYGDSLAIQSVRGIGYKLIGDTKRLCIDLDISS